MVASTTPNRIFQFISGPAKVVGLVVTVLAVVLLALASWPLSSTPIWIDVRSHFVTFLLREPTSLWHGKPVSKSIIDGLFEVQFSHSSHVREPLLDSDEELQISVQPGIAKPANCHQEKGHEVFGMPFVGIRSVDGQITMSLDQHNNALVLDMENAAPLVVITGKGQFSLMWDSGCHVIGAAEVGKVHARGRDDVRIKIWLDKSASPVLVDSVIPLSELQFMDVLSTEGEGGTTRRPRSGIIEGNIYFEEFSKRKLPLRANIPLSILVPDVSLASLQIDRSSFRVRAFGNATEVRTGFGNYMINHMPTVLEWLSSRHSIVLAWTALVLIIGAAAAVLRSMVGLKKWTRETQEPIMLNSTDQNVIEREDR